MARVRPIKTNFTNGEVDPLITMRSDLQLFLNGAAYMRNALPFPQGGFRRRDGLEFMTVIPPSGTKPIGLVSLGDGASGSGYVIGELLTLVGGTFSTQAAQVRVIALSGTGITGVQMVATGDYSIVPASPAATTSDGAGTGATITITDVNLQDVLIPIDFQFSVSQNYLVLFGISRWYVFRKEDTGSGANQLVFTGHDNVYDNEQLKEITWTQSLDVMLIFQKDLPIRQLSRTGETSWTFTEFAAVNLPSFAFGERQTADITVTYTDPTVVGDARNIAIAPGTWPADADGKYVRILATSDADGQNFSSYFRIISGQGTATVSAEILALPTVLKATTSYKVGGLDWLLEELEWSFSHGYPRCGIFDQGRLITAGTKDRPQTVYSSRAGDIFDFNSGSTDDDFGFTVTADTGEQSTIQNIFRGRHLQFFADNSEYYVPISELDPITPTNMLMRQTSQVGSLQGIQVFEVDGTVYFAQRGGGSFREFSFVDSVKAYDSNIVSLFSSHLVRNPADISLKKSLNTEDGNYIWVVNGDDNSLSAFSLLKSELINAWSNHTTEGEFRHTAVLDQTTYFHTRRWAGGVIKDTGNVLDLLESQGANPNPQGSGLSGDGTTLIVIDNMTDKAYEYALNFDNSLRRVIYTGNSFDLSNETGSPKDIVLQPFTGKKMFIIDLTSGEIIEYDLDKPNTLIDGNVTDSTFRLDFQSELPSGTGFDISQDGLRVIISATAADKIDTWTLNTAWTFEDGYTHDDQELDITSIDTSPQDVKWSHDNLRFFVAGSEKEKIFQFTMPTEFDVANAVVTAEFDVSDIDGNPFGLGFSQDGKTLIFCGTENDRVYELSLTNDTQFGERFDVIEFFQSGLKFDNAVCVQSGITTPVTQITGAVQLANEEVGIIIDDVIYENQVVSSTGALTFPISAKYNYQVGLPFPNVFIPDEDNELVDTGFNVLVRTLPADILFNEGTNMGKQKRVVSCTVRYDKTQGFYLQGYQVPFRSLPDILDRPIPLQTGQKELRGLTGYDEFGQITIGQIEPLDMTVLGLGYDLSTGV